ncbi:MAG TPA: hypothetical protein VI168_03490 [Croceibacterium sp.]
MEEPDFILFASDATLVGMAGAVLLTMSVATFFGERRRMRRKHIDAVGWMPWSAVSVLTTFAGLSLLAVAVTGWLKG